MNIFRIISIRGFIPFQGISILSGPRLLLLHHYKMRIKSERTVDGPYNLHILKLLPGCDFVFPGIFYCDVAHNKRAIKSVLVFLLGDDLRMWIS